MINEPIDLCFIFKVTGQIVSGGDRETNPRGVVYDRVLAVVRAVLLCAHIDLTYADIMSLKHKDKPFKLPHLSLIFILIWALGSTLSMIDSLH